MKKYTAQMDNATDGMSNVPLAVHIRLMDMLPYKMAPSIE